MDPQPPGPIETQAQGSFRTRMRYCRGRTTVKTSLDADQGCALFQVSSATELLLKDAFTRTVANGTRRRWREHYGMPASRFTKCPKLDTTLKSKLPKTCKDADRPLAKTQALLLDAVGPLAHLLEQELSKDVAEAVTQSLRFLGNASATISNERRR